MLHVTEHSERYAHISVMATDEVAAQSDSIESTGISHADLDQDVGNVIDGMRDVDDPGGPTSIFRYLGKSWR